MIKRLDPTLDIHKCLQEGKELSPNTKEGILAAFTIIIGKTVVTPVKYFGPLPIF